MEWIMPVNDMLHDEITKLNCTLVPPGFHGDIRAVRLMQESLSKVIDILGEQSTVAQGLNKVITTAEKLRNAPTHILYLLKDASAKGGKGEVIGLLKVGRKHLFLFDERDQVREVEPLCVLDFFVVPDRQRHGYGRLLFDHMLHDMEATAHELAVDGPSPKMEQFLVKTYGVERLVRQNNNFAITPRFFATTENCISKSGRSTPAAVSAAVGRFAAPKPHSAIATVIHGGGFCQEASNGCAPGRGSPEEGVTRQVETPLEKAPVEKAPVEAAPVEKAPVQEARVIERPSSLRVSAAPTPTLAAGVPTPSPGGGSARRDSQLTEQGFFDVKFYHNRLW